jgi:hypothetical protein
MLRSNNHAKFLHLRKDFPFLIFEKQEYMLDSGGLSIRFTFNLADQYKFYPTLFIPRKSCILPDKEIAERLPLLVFHIGMIELISYWKVACPPKVIINPSTLTSGQISWWKKLYYHGLGEFLYLNSIDIDVDNLMDIVVVPNQTLKRANFPLTDSVLIPVGGGKDSCVTLELLGNTPGTTPLIMNPRGASLGSARTKGFSDNQIFEVHRQIDPSLLLLNEKGFLNGHTPFSALLGFITLLASAMTGKKYIALSNESSANEPTIPGTTINHQYSKSLTFESDLREYISQWIHPDISYFSFLRPLNELQIASLFSRYTAFHPVFRSCNAGSKTNEWCGKCAKCLFTWIILSPFIGENELLQIFGKNLWQDPLLRRYFDQLTGIAEEKPFDCVGTVNEVNAAIQEVIKRKEEETLPLLLQHYMQQYTSLSRHFDSFRQVLADRSGKHNIPSRFDSILNREIYG